MSINRPCLKIAQLLIFMILHGCFFPVMWSTPGYMVSIESQKVNKKDAAVIEGVLSEHDFNAAAKRVTDERCVWYKKDIAAGKQIDHPYVKVGVCYDDGPGKDIVKDFRILVMNAWEGRNAQLKQEIDSIADILITELKKLVRAENIAVRRKTTGPPF